MQPSFCEFQIRTPPPVVENCNCVAMGAIIPKTMNAGDEDVRGSSYSSQDGDGRFPAVDVVVPASILTETCNFYYSENASRNAAIALHRNWLLLILRRELQTADFRLDAIKCLLTLTLRM